MRTNMTLNRIRGGAQASATVLVRGLCLVIIFAIFLLPTFQSAVAQDSTTAPAQKDAKAPAKEIRDPFWPIGYWPSLAGSTNAAGIRQPIAGIKTNAAPQEILISWPELKVKGLTKQADGSYLAIVDGVGIVEAGQIVQIRRDGFIFKYKISEINKKGILQQKLDYKPDSGKRLKQL